jgi:hypothetical protein
VTQVLPAHFIWLLHELDSSSKSCSKPMRLSASGHGRAMDFSVAN